MHDKLENYQEKYVCLAFLCMNTIKYVHKFLWLFFSVDLSIVTRVRTWCTCWIGRWDWSTWSSSGVAVSKVWLQCATGAAYSWESAWKLVPACGCNSKSLHYLWEKENYYSYSTTLRPTASPSGCNWEGESVVIAKLKPCATASQVNYGEKKPIGYFELDYAGEVVRVYLYLYYSKIVII